MTPEETIRAALARLKVVKSRHGGVATYPAFAALEALIEERDELREVVATLSGWGHPQDPRWTTDDVAGGAARSFDVASAQDAATTKE